MRSFIKVLFVVLLGCAGMAFTGCKNKCGTTTCQNGGTCVDNKCSCPTGFTGNSCQTAADAAVIGTYNCSRANCSPAVGGVNSWKSAITGVANNGYLVNISNFDNGNITLQASVDSMQNIVITPAAGTYGVSASGKYVNGTITLNFTTSSAGGGVGYRCVMTMVKI